LLATKLINPRSRSTPRSTRVRAPRRGGHDGPGAASHGRPAPRVLGPHMRRYRSRGGDARGVRAMDRSIDPSAVLSSSRLGTRSRRRRGRRSIRPTPSLPPSLSPSPPSQRRGEGGKERAPPRRVRRVRRRVGRPRGRGAARLGMAPPARSSRERRRREGGFGRPAREPRRGDAAFDADADAPAPRARRACRIVDVPRILRARPERGRRRAARRAGRDASPLRARSRRAQARVLRRRRRRRARRLRRAQLLRVQGVGANEGVVGRRAEGRPGVQGGGVPRPRVAARR
jgi:hypothetical protein